MPMSRYEVRNEYSLADPELYRAADKDDPEALLEGVAMAGLVGVLRQLGDLAEFAAEIFHNLHEDVMATASRGHTLAFRVQQLEMEIPSLERALLSQTDHSSFFSHPSVDWHPKPRHDGNLVTHEDMPRFIMESYEECREPPRLFLLDKFDVAGAGACLKRYTDPSFFKVETSEMTSADIHKEKKVRKAKKKGPRWRNRETREVLSTSHTKLHQLFLEERVENGISTTSRLAKLKRRLNGFPFNSKEGESYMEKILRSPSPDHEVLHEMSVESLQQKLATNDRSDSAYNMFEFRPVSYDREEGGRKRSTPISLDRESVAQNPFKYDSDESLVDDKVCEIPSSHPNVATNGITSALNALTGEKVVAVDAESNREGSFTGNESDGMASEIDNFVDAPSTMESEMNRDSDMRMKRDDSSAIRMESLITDAYEEPFRSRSSDSQSTGHTTMSDVGNNSSTKEVSSFSSDSPSISAEKPESESSSNNEFQCTDISVNEIVDTSSYQSTIQKPASFDETHSQTDAFANRRSESEQASSSLCREGSIPSMHSDCDELVRGGMLPPQLDEKVSTLNDEEENTHPSEGPVYVASNGTCVEANAPRSELDLAHSTSWPNESVSTLELSDLDKVVGGHTTEAPGSDETVSVTDDKEKMMNLVTIPPFSPSACISRSQSEDDLSRSTDGEKTVDEPNDQSVACLSTVHDTYPHTADTLVKTSSNMLHEDESDGECLELADDAAPTVNIPNVLSTSGTLATMVSGNDFQDKFEDEFPEVPENSPSDNLDGARDGDNIEPEGDNLNGAWDDEDSNVSTDSLNYSPHIMEASPEKGLEEISLASAHTLTVEDSRSNSSTDNENSLENLKLSHLAHSPDSPMEGLDAHDEDTFSEEDTTVNETPLFGILESCEVVGLQSADPSYNVSPNDSEAVEVSHTSKDLKEPAGASNIVEMDENSESSGSNAQEVSEITSSAELEPVNEIREMLSKPADEADTSNTTYITSPSPAVSEDSSLGKLVEEHNDCLEDSGIRELKNDEICPSEGDSDHMDKVSPAEASASGFGSIICNSVNNDHPDSELSGLIPNSHLDLEIDQLPTEQCGLDRDQERFHESSLENQVSDAPSLPVHNDTEDSVQSGLPSSHLDQHLLHPSEISPQLSPSLPVNYQRVLDNGDGKEDSNVVSGFPTVNGSNPPLFSALSRLSNEIIVPGHFKNPLGSISPPSNPFLQANPNSHSDLPPLPPLPPVQWMMGKLQHASPSSEEEMPRNEESFPQSVSITAATADDSVPPTSASTADGSAPPTSASTADDSAPPTSASTADDSAPPTASTAEDSAQPTASTHDKNSFREETKDLETEVAAEAILKEENLVKSITSPEAKTLPDTTDPPSKMDDKPQLLATPISEGVSTSSATEDGAENGSQKLKLRPRNPLVDDASFLDKSKLRKVTDRVRPEIPKVEERDSLLEQIRTKSFNLKPAMSSRPSLRARGPNTNLKVVAILEKASAIRQAFAGSDEDDDDSWSE